MDKMRVRESIDFKRGKTSKEALGVGDIHYRKEYTKIREGMMEWFKRDFEPLGFFDIGVTATEDGYPDEIHFSLKHKDFENLHTPGIGSLLRSWISENSHYKIEELEVLNYDSHKDQYNPTIRYKLTLDVNVFNESVNFKRGQPSKEAMNVGIKARTKTKDGLIQVFSSDLKSEGFSEIDVMTWQGNVDSLEFKIPKDKFEKDFDNDKKELVRFLARWLNKNTDYYLNDLQNHKYGQATTKLAWHLNLKTWDNYDKK